MIPGMEKGEFSVQCSMGTGMKQLGNETDNSLPSSAKLRIHPSIWLNGVRRDSFTFNLVFH